MSFRNDDSCRIDDTGIFENVGADPRLQSAFGHKIDAAPGEQLQFLNERFKLDQTDAYAGLELHHDVDVALGTHIAADRRPKQRQFLTP